MKNKQTENLGIKKYIQYVKRRVLFLNFYCLKVYENQINYFEALSRAIDEYGSRHTLFMRYILGRISFNKLKNLLGEPDKQVFRYIKRQREMLKAYIVKKELECFANFPYEEIV